MSFLLIIVCVLTSYVDRIISLDSYGQRSMQRTDTHVHTGFISIHYTSRALEWINVQKKFQKLFVFFQFSYMCSLVENITFAWSYDRNLTSVLYKPGAVFKQFSFVHLLSEGDTCACTSCARLRGFSDPFTITEMSSFCKLAMHICTMDINIIQHKLLRSALSQCLNHIPLQPTIIAKAVASIMHAFEQLILILHLEQLQFPIDVARLYLHRTCLNILKASSQANKWGFRFSGKFLFDISVVKNRLVASASLLLWIG